MIEWIDYTGKFLLTIILTIGAVLTASVILATINYIIMEAIPEFIKAVWAELIPDRFKKTSIIITVVVGIVFFSIYIGIGIAYTGGHLK